jgi:hypothetical protein
MGLIQQSKGIAFGRFGAPIAYARCRIASEPDIVFGYMLSQTRSDSESDLGAQAVSLSASISYRDPMQIWHLQLERHCINHDIDKVLYSIIQNDSDKYGFATPDSQSHFSAYVVIQPQWLFE